jgi:hypothetical protein
MAVWLADLAGVLRRAGLYVVEVAGWQTRSYPTWTPPGYIEPPTHIMVHHTASNTTPENDVNYLLTAPISPIANIYLARNGACHVLAAGRVATNGKGSSLAWNGGVPDNTMNHYAISIEAANNGIGEPWPKVQTDAYVTLCAALSTAYGIPVDHVRGHFEWAPGRKIDPAGPSPWATGAASWDMNAFRRDVRNRIAPHIELGDNMKLLNPSKRVYDSRTVGQQLNAGEERMIPVPTTDAAVMVNIIAVGGGAGGYITAWGGGARPTTSAVNFGNSSAIGNTVVVPVVNGHFNIFVSQRTHVIVDLYASWPAV